VAIIDNDFIESKLLSIFDEFLAYEQRHGQSAEQRQQPEDDSLLGPSF
jgi:hypothetical protein